MVFGSFGAKCAKKWVRFSAKTGAITLIAMATFAAFGQTKPLNDTGITFCSGATSGNNNPCPGGASWSHFRNYNNPADIGSKHDWEPCVRGDSSEHFGDCVSIGGATLPAGWVRPQFLAMGNPVSLPPFTSLKANVIEVQRLAMSAIPGLVGNWTFDQCSGIDSSGLSNHGSFANGVICESGVSGTAIRLNSSNYVEIPHSARLSLSTAFTLSTWFKADALTPNYPLRLIDKITAGYSDGYMFPVWSNGLALSAASGAQVNVSITSGVFHHAAVTFDSGVARFFLMACSKEAATLVRPQSRQTRFQFV